MFHPPISIQTSQAPITDNFHLQFKLNTNPVISDMLIILLQIYAHITTALLLCHVQDTVEITFSQFGWEQNELILKLYLNWNPTTQLLSDKKQKKTAFLSTKSVNSYFPFSMNSEWISWDGVW